VRHDPDKHHRRSIRLKEYDYSQPRAYFVTICTRERECLFDHVVNGEMQLNDAGEITRRCFKDIPVHFPFVELDAFVVMPNHVHGVIMIQGRGEASVVPQTTCAVKTQCRRGERSFAPTTTTTPKSPSRTIGSIVRGFKIGVTKWFRANTNVHSVWQRGYYEHVVRDEDELEAIREYIQGNPARWDEDDNNPLRLDYGSRQTME
jgi:putative transposase